MMDPLTNEIQPDHMRTLNRVPEQMVPKIESGIIEMQHHTLEHSSLDSPQKLDSNLEANMDGDSHEGWINLH